jgi:hypothetical protein
LVRKERLINRPLSTAHSLLGGTKMLVNAPPIAKLLAAAGEVPAVRSGLIHEGGEVSTGLKYVLRSDVMYGRPGVLAG